MPTLVSSPTARLRRSIPTVSLLALAAGFFAGGCTRAPQFTTHAAGHTITAEIAGSPSVRTDAEQAVLQSEFGQVTIERTRVRVDAQPWTGIPADVPVNVRILRGRLHLQPAP